VALGSTRPDAIAAAEALRARRRDLVSALAEGRIDIGDLTDPSYAAAPVKTVVLAGAVPGVGKVRSRRILAALGVADGTRWGELPVPLVAALVEALHQPVGDDAATAGGA